MYTKIWAVLVVALLVFDPYSPAMAQANPTLSAADLRTGLNTLLMEHVYVDGLVTGAIVRADTAAIQATSDILEQNNVEIGQVINLAYGPDAQQSFLTAWRAHVSLLEDYAQAAAVNDTARKEQTLAALNANRQDLDAFFTRLNPKIAKGTVAKLLVPHVTTLPQFMDALAAQDPDTAFAKLQESAQHMQMLADPLAIAIARQMPDKFDNASAIDSGWADLRIRLNNVLLEHIYLVYYAADAAVGGRDAEFQVVIGARDHNTTELGRVVSAVYTPSQGKAFLDLWREHIGYFGLYIQGATTNDANLKQTALVNTNEYARKLDTLLSGANPNIAKGSIVSLLAPHITGLTQAVDTLAAHDPVTALKDIHQDGHHMQTIADTLALAIGKQFPDRFGPGAPAMVPVTGGDPMEVTVADLVRFAPLSALATLLAASLLLHARQRRPV